MPTNAEASASEAQERHEHMYIIQQETCKGLQGSQVATASTSRAKRATCVLTKSVRKARRRAALFARDSCNWEG